jgi:hypothetical protein
MASLAGKICGLMKKLESGLFKIPSESKQGYITTCFPYFIAAVDLVKQWDFSICLHYMIL